MDDPVHSHFGNELTRYFSIDRSRMTHQRKWFLCMPAAKTFGFFNHFKATLTSLCCAPLSRCYQQRPHSILLRNIYENLTNLHTYRYEGNAN